MDYASLRLFQHLARSLHYGRTSRACAISPSALSRAIQRLETEVGRPLLKRDSRHVSLTQHGVRMLEFADDALARFAQLQSDLSREPTGLRGQLTLFATVTACQSFLPALLSRFREAYPHIQLRLETGYAADALETLVRGEVDVTVAALPEKLPDELVARVVVYTPLIFVAPVAPCEVSRLAAQQPIAWSELPLVLPATGLARRATERWYQRQRLSLQLYGEVTGNEAILSLVATGCGVGVVPQLVMDKSPLAHAVRALEVSPRIGEFRVGLCTRRSSLEDPLIRALWEVLEDE